MINPAFVFGGATLYHADCLGWLEAQPQASVHGVLTDPPYGLVEYTNKELTKRQNGRGGVWRIPPSYDGHARAPLPRFTTLNRAEQEDLYRFFFGWASVLKPVMVQALISSLRRIPCCHTSCRLRSRKRASKVVAR